MKDIIIGDTQYSGVSKIKLNTVGGSTAQFQDVDELGTPTGSISITANGSYDVEKYAKAVVAVPTEGSNGNMEAGTFTLEAESKVVEIPVSSKKTHVVLWADPTTLMENNAVLATFGVTAVSGWGFSYAATNANGSDDLGYFAMESEYTPVTEETKPMFCIFGDSSIKLAVNVKQALQKFPADVTFNWVAW